MSDSSPEQHDAPTSPNQVDSPTIAEQPAAPTSPKKHDPPTSPEQPDAPTIPGITVDGRSKVLADPEPLSARTLAYIKEYDAERAAELDRTVSSHNDKDFKDFRRDSEATQPASSPVEKNAETGGERLTHGLENARRGIRGLSPGREVSREEIAVPVFGVEEPKSLKEEVKVAEPSTEPEKEKAAGPSKEPEKKPYVMDEDEVEAIIAKLQTDVLGRKDAERLQFILSKWMLEEQPQFHGGVPQSRPRLTEQIQDALAAYNARFRDATNWRAHVQGLLDVEEVGDLAAVKLAEWIKKQPAPGPNEAAVKAKLAALKVQSEEPRHSFRSKQLQPVVEDEREDPRHSFRPKKSSMKQSAYLDIAMPTNDRKLTWIESIFDDYPKRTNGSDMKMDFGVLLKFISGTLLLVASLYWLLTAAFLNHKYTSQYCTNSLVNKFSSIGKAYNVPDFCALKGLQPSTSPIVQDPFGLDQVYSWPITLSHLEGLTNASAHLTSNMETFVSYLHKAAEVGPDSSHNQELFSLGSSHLEKRKIAENSLERLVARYKTLLVDLTTLPQWTTNEISALAVSSTDSLSGLRLMWGPLFGLRTPLGSMKKKFRSPIKDFQSDLDLLETRIRTTKHALIDTAVEGNFFSDQLDVAGTFWLARCVSKSLLWGQKVSKVGHCKGLQPVLVKQAFEVIKKEETWVFETAEAYSRELRSVIREVNEFYQVVMKELDDVSGRKFGDVEVETLESLREFVGEVVERTEKSTERLKLRLE